MTNCEKLYNFFIEHPKASADDVMEALDWERRQVSRYKHRLKRRGFIDVDPVDGVQLLRPYREEEDTSPIHDYTSSRSRTRSRLLSSRKLSPTSVSTFATRVSRSTPSPSTTGRTVK